jgi:RNA polymerase sigma-B factor
MDIEQRRALMTHNDDPVEQGEAPRTVARLAGGEGATAYKLLQEYARTRDVSLRNRLVLMHERLVHHVVSRFTPSRGNTVEDLFQVANLGLMAAIERYDPARGAQFITFAVPTMVGILKHHLRDYGWMLKVPRDLRDLALSLPGLRAELEHRLGHPPTVAEMAAAARVDEERLLEAMDVSLAADPVSLDAPVEGDGDGFGSRWEAVGRLDPALAAVAEREALRGALAQLEPRLQTILEARFVHGESQATLARRIGVSQMQVSRLERQALARLKMLLS